MSITTRGMEVIIMKIERIIDGKNIVIELTRDELFKAYKEQQRNFAIGNIQDNMEFFIEKDKLEKYKNDNNFIEKAASILIENQVEYDMDFEHAIVGAINEALADCETRQEGV